MSVRSQHTDMHDFSFAASERRRSARLARIQMPNEALSVCFLMNWMQMAAKKETWARLGGGVIGMTAAGSWVLEV